MCLVPADRASLDSVKAKIRNLSLEYKILKTEHFGAVSMVLVTGGDKRHLSAILQLEAYSTNLEKKVEDTISKLELEKEQTDAILGSEIRRNYTEHCYRCDSTAV